MSTFKAIVAQAVVVCFVIVPSFAEEKDRGLEQIDGPESSPTTAFEYRKKWLVVVGTNYDDVDTTGVQSVETGQNEQHPGVKKLPALRNAQSDATAVHQILVNKFGFEDRENSLLVGKNAKCKLIQGKIGELEDQNVVTEDDCVFVYFSGHGVLLRNQDNSATGYLLPDDVELQSNDAVNTGTAIEMNFVVKTLLNCPAKHRFLVIDSCHSGAVFRLNDIHPDRDIDSSHKELDVDEFKAKGFQVLTASRDNQKASDGRDGHSPFTNALLVSLKTLPLLTEQTNGHRSFTVSRLFENMRPHLRRDGISNAQRGHIGGDLGEFHFMPDPAADFREGIDRNELLAMTPTSFGNWWAYEVPWFMPGLRLAILQQNAPSRSMSDELDPKSLLDAAKEAMSQAAKDKTNLTALFRMRYRHLDELMAAKNVDAQKLVMRSIIKELEGHISRQDTKLPPDTTSENNAETNSELIQPTAEDIHYLAVLYHFLGDPDNAEKQYTLALKKYDESNTGNGNHLSLKALCLLDAGMLSTSRREYDIAKLRIKDAQEHLGEKAPWPFRVFALSREAEVYRREGRFQLSQVRMDIAVQMLPRFDATLSTLLSANTMKVRAWAYMEGWDFENARRDFQAAEEILIKFDESRIESSIDRLHVLHGQAMIERFQGRSADALNKYRELTLRIANHISELENSTDTELLNYAEVRSLLIARLVNSLERQADCMLFGESPDFAEAADDYRRAIHECRSVGEEKSYAQLIDLLYRKAIAICLNAATPKTDIGVQKPVASEFELARWICAEAEELEKKAIAAKELTDLSFKTKTVQKMAYACLRLQADSSDPLIVKAAGFTGGSELPKEAAQPIGCFTSLLSELNREASACDRDELERLMFLHKVLIDYREQLQIEPYQNLKHIGQLLAYCRSACRLPTPDPKLLAYLRPYYDTAFVAHAELLPGHSKELIEIAYEATHGTPYRKSGSVQPLLAMYIANKKCYLLVDAPGSVSQTFTVDESISVEDFMAASDASVRDHLPLPDVVRRILRELEPTSDQKSVELRWRDPVLSIGVERKSPAESGFVVTLRPDLDARSLPEQADADITLRFPFNLQGQNRLTYTEDRNPLCVKPTNASADNPRSASPGSEAEALPEDLK